MRLAIATMVSAVLFYVSIGAGTLWAAAWLAPVPILTMALATPRGRDLAGVAGAATLAFGVGLGNLVILYAGILPVTALLPAIAILAIAYGGTVWWFGYLGRRSPVIAAFAFAATWTAVEWLAGLASPHGTAGSIAYSQGNVPLLIGIAAITGQYGVTFALCLVPASLAGFVHDRSRRILPAVALATLAIVVGYGLADSAPRDPSGALRVGLVASDGHREAAEATAQDGALAPLALYAGAIERAARGGARLVVLPERVTAVRAPWSDQVDRRLRGLAARQRVDIVVGLGDFVGTTAHNTAAVYPASGGPPRVYRKRHLIPGIERMFEPGIENLVLDGGLGVAICKDLDFQDVARA